MQHRLPRTSSKWFIWRCLMMFNSFSNQIWRFFMKFDEFLWSLMMLCDHGIQLTYDDDVFWDNIHHADRPMNSSSLFWFCIYICWFRFQAMPGRKEPQRLRHLLVQCIGKMYTLGYSVNFTLLQTQTNAKFHRVPTYPWQETALWANDEYCGVEKTSLLLGAPISVAAEQTHWENEFGFHFFEFFRDHQIKGLGIIISYLLFQNHCSRYTIQFI